MNIVFWLIVIVALAFLWLCMSFLFEGVGSVLLKLIKGANEAINGDADKESTKESKENVTNEG